MKPHHSFVYTLYLGCNTTCASAVQSVPHQHSYSNSNLIFHYASHSLLEAKLGRQCRYLCQNICYHFMIIIPAVLHILLSSLCVYTVFASWQPGQSLSFTVLWVASQFLIGRSFKFWTQEPGLLSNAVPRSLQTLQLCAVVAPPIRPRPLPITHSSIPCSFITQPFDAMYSELLAASLHKQYVRQTYFILWKTRYVSGASGRVRNVAELKTVLTKLRDRRRRGRDWIPARRNEHFVVSERPDAICGSPSLLRATSTGRRCARVKWPEWRVCLSLQSGAGSIMSWNIHPLSHTLP